MYTYLRDIGPLSSSRPSFPGFGPLDLMASCFCLLKSQLVIFTTGDDRFSILTCPPEFDPDSLKRNDGANFNFILDCPPIWSCPKSVLGFRCLQEGVGYLQRLHFHVGFLEFQSHCKIQKLFGLPQSGHATPVLWASGVCRKGLVICKDGVFMWDFWNFKVIPSTKTILMFV